MSSTIRTRTISGVCGALLAAAWMLSPATAAATEAAGQSTAADESATITVEANVRAEPNTSSAILATLPQGTSVSVECWTQGEPTYGNDLHGSMWLLTNYGGWTHSHLITPVDVPPCDTGPAPGGTYYENCDAARDAGAAPVYRGEPGYGRHLDHDNDGIGCED